MFTLHPGEYIREVYIEPLELSQAELAERLGVSVSSVSRLIACKAMVTAEMAVRLEHVLGRSAESWLKMQSAYSLSVARRKVSLESLGTALA